MREALAALVGHAFAELALRRLEAEVNPDNVASCRIVEALGFTHEGTLRERWVGKRGPYDTRLYGLLAAEWTPPNGPRIDSAAGRSSPRR